MTGSVALHFSDRRSDGNLNPCTISPFTTAANPTRTGTLSSTFDLSGLVRMLARRTGGAEANVQADVRNLLLYGGLNLGEDDLVEAELEVQVGGGRRIDIETGLTVIEVKRDLRPRGAARRAGTSLVTICRAVGPWRGGTRPSAKAAPSSGGRASPVSRSPTRISRLSCRRGSTGSLRF